MPANMRRMPPLFCRTAPVRAGRGIQPDTQTDRRNEMRGTSGQEPHHKGGKIHAMRRKNPHYEVEKTGPCGKKSRSARKTNCGKAGTKLYLQVKDIYPQPKDVYL